MAELTIFAYLPGNTALHRIDIRFKLVAIIVLNIISLQSQLRSLLLLSLPILVGCILVKLPAYRSLREMRYLLLFLGILFFSRAIEWNGGDITILLIPFSFEGAIDGALTCWRLMIIILSGLLFVSTSRPLDVKAAIEWFLKAIPFVPEKRIALIIGLMIRFLPEILRQSSEIAEAQKARGIENRKNPVYRMAAFSIPLFRKIFESADDLATAMEARCFDEMRTDTTLSAKTADWIFSLITTLFYVMLLFL